ncbi:hypothetical protein CLV63_13717 [Murinocardiopsis flavida]|uniref:Uncharacterized protein n=1 Tax=Murinocardiopsis flavida TaxID=645275 RepID=A0A2P8CLV6_9ACTN|nr:hypothetical protein [Murinocardiopsis flavida]PSK85958.1 hypothetical protein CLV63_13717 [Murinocardiopsis flavida]
MADLIERIRERLVLPRESLISTDAPGIPTSPAEHSPVGVR